jgi:RNA polymerase sigma factor (sigma-70 family)
MATPVDAARPSPPPPPGRGDEEIHEALLACRRRDPEGLERLYALLAPQLFGFLRRMLPRKDLAEEALQDTFVNVWRRCEDYDVARGEIRTWIFAVAHHRAIDILRRERRLVATPDVDLEALLADTPGEDPHEPLSRHEEKRLRDCLGRLSRDQRHVLFLAYYHDRTQEEIARTLGSPLGTVKSWMRRGLLGLRRCLEAP